MVDQIVEQSIPPGEQTYLGEGGLPIAVVDSHNEVFYYWQKSGIKNAILFHIDAHHDMKRGAPVLNNGDSDDYFMNLDIDKFIPPAFYNEIISFMYWLNPHSEERRLQYMGSNSPDEGERRIRACTSKRFHTYEHFLFRSDVETSDFFDEKANYIGIIKTIKELNIKGDRPFILDIDLDAFSCGTDDIAGVPKDYIKFKKGVGNYELRIDNTLDVLSNIGKRPELVTIARSKGKKILLERKYLGFRKTGIKEWNERLSREVFVTSDFTTPEFLDNIESLVLKGLEELWG